MKALVLDVSVTLGFLLKDEQDQLSLRALAAIKGGVRAIAPAHWPVEVANALLMAERRRRISQSDAAEILNLVQRLAIEIDRETAAQIGGVTFGLARQYTLTIYDAAYLELAMRHGATLATTDHALALAAKAAGVAVLNE